MTIRKHPRVRLKPGAHKRLKGGHPWVYSNEVVMDAAAKALPAGTVVTLEDAGGAPLATAHFNPKPLISARVLELAPDVAIDRSWYTGRLKTALALRERLVAKPYYRWVHAEGDGLPGLIIDRIGDVAVLQPNTAGMDAAADEIAAAIDDLIKPTAIVLRGDSSSRTLEGLPEVVRTLKGEITGPLEVHEPTATFFADVLGGQKTGWFFDQRDNRTFAALLAKDKTVLDLYTHTGGFAVSCAVAGAKSVLGVDGSNLAIELAEKAAAVNGVASTCKFERFDVFEFLNQRKAKFDIVIADPPAFVKSRKDIKPGLQGYRKLARLCAQTTAPGGIFIIASCSHNASLADLTDAVSRGIADAGRTAKLLKTSGAGPDHPVHFQLPEGAYLKALTFALD